MQGQNAGCVCAHVRAPQTGGEHFQTDEWQWVGSGSDPSWSGFCSELAVFGWKCRMISGSSSELVGRCGAAVLAPLACVWVEPAARNCKWMDGPSLFEDIKPPCWLVSLARQLDWPLSLTCRFSTEQRCARQRLLMSEWILLFCSFVAIKFLAF